MRALLYKDWLTFKNILREGKRQSRFKQIFVTAFAGGLLLGLWRLFMDGFRFLTAMGGIGTILLQRLFALFFFSLLVMLLISSMITAYGIVWRSRTLPGLILSPLPHGQRILHQWLETTLFSGWAFFFIMVPFIAAFAAHAHLSAWSVIWTIILSLPFVLTACGIGMLLSMLAVRWLPRIRPWQLGAVIVVGLGFWWLRAAPPPEKTEETFFLLAQLVPGLRLAACPLWPSYWVAEAVLAFNRADFMRGAGLSATLLANMLMTGVLLEYYGAKWFFPAWQATLLPGRAAQRRRLTTAPDRHNYGAVWDRLLFFAPMRWRALILKDWRQVGRDPLQWTQGAIFFGLLAIYFLNLRNFNYHLLDPLWRNLIAFLNIFSLATIMSSFCARFIYPQMSLEGQSCWLLQTAPIGMGRILLAKFIAAAGALTLISIGLLVLSSFLLKVPAPLYGINILLGLALAAGLSALATGLGAIFMDLHAANPVVIISGFGGTLNLALSLGYILLAVLPFAMFYHWFHLGRITAAALQIGLAAATVWLLILTAITVAVPLALAYFALKNREY